MNIFFTDLDGTLEDSRIDMTNCVHMVRNKFGLPPLDTTYIKQFVNKGMDNLYQKCFSDFLDINHNNYIKIKEEYEKTYFSNVCIHTQCYPGIPQALEKLAERGKIIVITNKPEHISRELLRKLSIDLFISDVMGGDSCAENKPSALPLEISAKKIGFDKDKGQSYMIGDSEADIQAAHAFGAISVWCKWGYLSELKSVKAKITVEKPFELESLGL